MSFMTRKRAAIAAVAVAGLLAVAACSGSDEQATGGPVTLTVFAEQGDNQDLATNVFTQQVADELGITFDFQTTTMDSTAAAEARQISLAGGDLPDMYLVIPWVDAFTQNEVSNLGGQGVLAPLNDLIDQYAPNIQQAFTEHPEYQQLATAPDGNIYGLPQWNDCFHCTYQSKLWINTDWLDALGLQMPTTTEEMQTVLQAFATEDPNGNGEADEIPISGAVGLADMVPFFMDAFTYDPLGGETTTLPIALDGDTVVAQPITDQWRAGLQYISGLYADGLIDPASFTQNVEALQAKGNNPDVPILGACSALHPAVCMALSDDDPRHTAYDAVPPLTGPDGVQYASYYFPSTPGAMFAITGTATPDEQIAAIKVADMLFEFTTRNDAIYGPEDVAWRAPEAGEVALDESLEPLFSQIARGDAAAEANDSWGSLGQLYSPAEWRLTEVVPEDIYLTSGYERRLFQASELYEPHVPMDQVFPTWQVWVDPTLTGELAALQTNITSYIDQSTAEFITGQRDINDDAVWQEYVDGFEGLGMSRYLEIYQAAYDTSNS